jgi:TadE-like protein
MRAGRVRGVAWLMAQPGDTVDRDAGRCRGDAGSVGARFVAFGFTMAVIFGLLQWGLYWHASQLANAAAEDGARRAQYRSATLDDGALVARRTLAGATGGGLLSDVTVTATAVGTDVTVTVEGNVPQLVPVPLPRRVVASSTGPKERFVNEGGP